MIKNKVNMLKEMTVATKLITLTIGESNIDIASLMKEPEGYENSWINITPLMYLKMYKQSSMRH